MNLIFSKNYEIIPNVTVKTEGETIIMTNVEHVTTTENIIWLKIWKSKINRWNFEIIITKSDI